MKNETIDEKLKKLFDDAVGVEDTIWYSETETLYEAILDLFECQQAEANQS